jgi:hypothetical protein
VARCLRGAPASQGRRRVSAMVPVGVSGVFSGATLKEGVEATVTELKALQPTVRALGQGGSGP